MLHTKSDEQLMAQVAAGNEAALELLYDRYATAVMGVAYRVVQNRGEAEDVVQETFWRAWENASQFQAQRGSCKNWLLGISRNLAIDALRRHKVRPSAAESEAVEILLEREPDEESDTAADAAANITHQQMSQALATLPNDQQTVLQLAYFGGLTRREIAEQENVPLGTVHTRARLALLKLGDLLREQGILS
jgi:RNA polymerase sigma-70 factor (ECF subfamily)